MSATGTMERLRGDLAGEARFDLFNRGLYATDASIYQIMPAGVAIPATVEDIAAVTLISPARAASRSRSAVAGHLNAARP